MSNLEELIERLCPDGVEYKTLGEFSNIVRGASPRPIKNYITSDEKGVNWIKIGDVRPGEKYITTVKEKITLEGATKSRFVNIGDFILSNSMSFGRPYILKVDGCIHDGWLAISQYEDFYDRDFLYYLLCSSKVQAEFKKKASFGGAVQNLNSDIVKSVTLPVPPLEVQREIVRILDNFAIATTEIQQKLQEELAARQKQYEYYRDLLLTFKSNESTILNERTNELELSGAIRWMKLGDIGSICMCKRILKSETNQNGGIPFYKIGTFGKQADAYISNEKFIEYKNRYKFPKKGDILISAAGTIGRTVVYDGKPAYFQDSNIVWIDNDETRVLNTFLNYWYSTSPWIASTGGTISRLYNDNIAKAPIPVPPLEVQQRIVDILDRFDTLCNDISSGLPAEIEMRQKQYEYYRDKLLTFKELKKEA